MKKSLPIFLFILLVLFSIYIFNTEIFATNSEKKINKIQSLPIRVEAENAKVKPISENLSLTGEFFANESVSIQSEVSGRIDYIGFSDGETVKKNTLLVRLDESLPTAEFLKNSAEYDLANSNLQRAKNLYKQNYLSSRSLDEITASQEIAKAKKELSKAILEQYKIKAPFSGKVGLRNISVGGYVKNGQELLIIEDLSILKFDFQVPERYSNLVSLGQRVSIQTNAFSKTIEGFVDAIDVSNKNRGRFLVLRTLINNKNKLLRSGMFGKIKLTLDKKEDGVVVSEEALFSEQSNKFVWIVAEGAVKKTPVITGLRLNNEVEIIKGLNNGDLVVTAGHLKLRKDGQKVEVISQKNIKENDFKNN